MNQNNQKNEIKKLVNTLNINITYYCTNNNLLIRKLIFNSIINNNLQNIIKKIDNLSSTIINKNKLSNNLELEKEKQLEIKQNNLKLKIELLKFSNYISPQKVF